MNNWRNTTIGKLVSLKRGYDLTRDERTGGNIPVIGAAGENGFHDTAKVKGPGIVLGRSGGSFGKAHFVQDDFWPHNTAMYVTDFKGNDPYFLFYLFKNLDFKNFNSGSAQPSLNRNYVYPIKVIAPEVYEQRKIGSILKNIDSKIELNNRINAELEAMAKMIYDYWFVQFDFPISAAYADSVGKPELEGRPYKSSGGEMVWNGEIKREVPKGWEVKKLSDFGKTVTGKTPSSGNPHHFGKGTPFLTPVDFNNSIKIHSEAARYLSTEGTLALKNHLLPKGSIMITCIGSDMGKIGIASQDSVTNQQINSLIPTDEFLSEYLYQTIYLILPYLKKLGKSGSTVPIVNKSTLDSITLLRPPFQLLKSFSRVTDPINHSIDNNVIQNQELASLRDWLLPMLMNGQVKVGEVKPSRSLTTADKDLEGLGREKEYVQGMAAEAKPEYGKLSIPENKTAFAKQVLGGKIVSLFKDDPNFTHIKFQKLQYLAEHIAEADLNWNYYRQSAGPYDPRFMHTVALKLKRSNWFAEKGYRYYPLEKVEQIENYYQGFFGPKLRKLQLLFEKLQNDTEDQAEIIATLYAVWNNRILENEEVSDPLLISDFREWSSRKQRYTDDQLMNALDWMREHRFIPRGFGYKIKEKKV